jgi:pSer/pThr/pTyr-binding forkhead associated (FHA) protein/Mg-chelatase subunit ChlD
MSGKFSAHGFSVKLAFIVFCLLIFLFACPKIIEAASDEKLELFFVIDNSGSMKKNDPNFMMPKTVRSFLQRLSPKTRVGMVMFDEKATLLEPLTPVSDKQAYNRLLQSLTKIDYGGNFTNSAAGLERALYELKTMVHPSSKKSIIFLTDGIVDTGNSQKDAELTNWLKNDFVLESKNEGVRIFGIAFTDNADFFIIQALSQRTGGAYYRAFNIRDISTVLDQIQKQLIPEPYIATPIQPKKIGIKEVAPSKPQIEPAITNDNKTKSTFEKVNEPPASVSKNGFSRIYWTIVLILIAVLLLLFFLFNKLYGWTSIPNIFQRVRGYLEKKNYRQVLSSTITNNNSPEGQGVNLEKEVADSLFEQPQPPTWKLHDLSQPDNPAADFNSLKITIGRDEKSDFVINKPTISSLHATIEYREAAFFLVDQRSSNGTRLNDHKLEAGQPAHMKSGDSIKFADREFKFVRTDQLVSGDTVLLEVTDFDIEPEAFNDSADNWNADNQSHLLATLKNHLIKVKALGKEYDQFVHQYFSDDTLSSLSVLARENMQATLSDDQQHTSPLVKGRVFYLLCTLPVSISNVKQWFGERFGGFTKYVLKWIQSEAYGVTSCDIFCMVTFGVNEKSWVSLTVVPTHDTDEGVEIMSVDFLNDAEKMSLEIKMDDQGRIL